jgi:hypothetical protein
MTVHRQEFTARKAVPQAQKGQGFLMIKQCALLGRLLT